MTTFNITEQEKKIVYESLLFQRKELKSKLDAIDSLINKYRDEKPQNVISIAPEKRSYENSTDDNISERVFEVLAESDTFLTSRNIVDAIKAKYIEVKELNKEEDRKYIGKVSATLSNRIKTGKIEKIKEDGKDPVYFIKKGQQIAAP